MSTTTLAPRAWRRWLRLLREAFAGGERDYTSEAIPRAIILLAVPMVLEMLMESVFALVDIVWVSRLGTDAIAAVGLTEGMMAILYALAIGLGQGATAMVSRRVGEKDTDGAAVAAVHAVVLAVLVSLAIAIPAGLAAADLLRLMGASPELIAGGAGYTRVMMAGNATILLLFVMNAVFRGAGDATRAMWVLWLANGINLVLDPCLIFGWGPFPELGLTGAAVATTIGRGTGVLWQLWLLGRGTGTVHVRRRHLAIRWSVLARLLRISLGGIAQYLIATASWVVLVRLVSSFGSAAVAGYTVAIRIVIFCLEPSWGVANAAATLVGQNLGAGRPDRAEAAVWRTAWYNAAFLAVIAVAFVVWSRPLVAAFGGEPDVVAYGAACLRILAYGYGFYAFGMVVVNAFNGAGDTMTPTWINVLCYWLFQLPLAWALAHRSGLGADGVFLSIPVAESLMTLVAIMVFRRGRWRHRRV
ncbi:MATE family efflux transporter [bacterium]|nr:MATE family efflux transporter [bacterium]